MAPPAPAAAAAGPTDFIFQIVVLAAPSAAHLCAQFLLQTGGGGAGPRGISSVGLEFVRRALFVEQDRIVAVVWNAGMDRLRTLARSNASASTLGVLWLYDVGDAASFAAVEAAMRTAGSMPHLLAGVVRPEGPFARVVDDAEAELLADEIGCPHMHMRMEASGDVEMALMLLAQDIRRRLLLAGAPTKAPRNFLSTISRAAQRGRRRAASFANSLLSRRPSADGAAREERLGEAFDHEIDAVITRALRAAQSDALVTVGDPFVIRSVAVREALLEIPGASAAIADRLAQIAAGASDLRSDLSLTPRAIRSKWVLPPVLAGSGPRVHVSVALKDWSFQWSVERGWTAIGGKGTVGTCHRRAATDKRTHLMNAYSSETLFYSPTSVPQGRDRSLKPYNCVRCSAIDTSDRVGQLRALLVSLGNGRIAARVRSLSLLTMSLARNAERAMADRQRKLLRAIPQIAFFNMQANSLALADPVAEKVCRSKNRPGFLKYLAWVQEELAEPLRAHGSELMRVSETETGVVANFVHAFYDDFDPQEVMVEMTSVLLAMQDLEAGLVHRAEIVRDLKHSREVLATFMQLADLQFSRPTSIEARCQSYVSFALLDVLLNVTTVVNCKSGCDRTALVHAISVAVSQLLAALPPNHPNHVAALDCLRNFMPLSTMVAAVGVPEGVDGVSLQIAVAFRNGVFFNLIEAGARIVVYSTGVTGFKFGLSDDWLRNNIFLPFLPPRLRVIAGDDDHTWSCDDPELRQFLMDASAFRGGEPSKDGASGA